jgi:hypothetical protein
MLSRHVMVCWNAGTTRVLAGTPGTKGCADGAVGVARFGWVHALALDAESATLYAADTTNHRIVSVALHTGVVTTIIGGGGGAGGYKDGSGGAVGAGVLNAPSGLAFDSLQKRLFIADTE